LLLEESRPMSKSEEPKIMLCGEMDPCQLELFDQRVQDAHREALAHLEVQQGLPEELKGALMGAELNCRLKAGAVLPVVQFDGGELHLAVPKTSDPVGFARSCLIRHGVTEVNCSFVTEDDRLCVFYCDRARQLFASCPITRMGEQIVLGTWKVENP